MNHKSQTDEKPGTATPLRRYQRLSKHQRAQFPGGPWGGEFVTLRVAVGKVGIDARVTESYRRPTRHSVKDESDYACNASY
jgi:hypothetical protein